MNPNSSIFLDGKPFIVNAPNISAHNAAPMDQELWRRFTEASTSREFCEGWLAILCSMIPDVQCALILLGPPDKGPFTPAAVWPRNDVSVAHLVDAAEQSLKDRRGLVIRRESDIKHHGSLPKGCHIAYPIEVSGKIHGTIILDVSERSEDAVSLIARQLHWGAAWLEVMVRRSLEAASGEKNERLRRVLDSIAAIVEHERFKPASMAFVTSLATMLECDRVSLGFMNGKRIVVQALSHSADFGERVNLMRAIASAMEEAIDQKAAIVYPPPRDSLNLIVREHESLNRKYETGAICTVPMAMEGRFFGALTLELPSNKALDEEDIELIKSVASLGGPILETKRKEDRWLVTKAADVIGEKFQKLIGPSHPVLMALGVLALFLGVLLAFAEGDYRIKTQTILEGSIQRAVSAPFSGYVAAAPKRAGDVVRKGELLCNLDDRDLRLEHLKWSTQRDQYQKEYRGAVAKHDRVQIRVISAKMDQAQAQIALLGEQLVRTKIVAPFEGLITSGDLSQSLGAPVERGQILFELAPLNSYRVILQIDEKNMTEIEVGQQGNLVLPSIPGETFPLRVSTITPVSTAKEGRNFFRVEADLGKASNRLRPGMEGIGKIEIGRRKLVWIWTHETVNWLRLKLWSWLP